MCVFVLLFNSYYNVFITICVFVINNNVLISYLCVYVCVCMCVYVCVCMYVPVCVCVYVCPWTAVNKSLKIMEIMVSILI